MTDERYVRVRVKAGARKERVSEEKGVYTIEVREKTERGEANARVREVLARALCVRPETLHLVKGMTSPSKTYLLT
jgi:uncharacterized protein